MLLLLPRDAHYPVKYIIMTLRPPAENEEETVTSNPNRAKNIRRESNNSGNGVGYNSHAIRCQLWIYFSVSNFVLLVAWIDIFQHDLIQNEAWFIFVVIILTLMVLLSIAMSSLLFTALFIRQTDKVLFLELNSESGSIVELVCICIWLVAFPLSERCLKLSQLLLNSDLMRRCVFPFSFSLVLLFFSPQPPTSIKSLISGFVTLPLEVISYKRVFQGYSEASGKLANIFYAR